MTRKAAAWSRSNTEISHARERTAHPFKMSNQVPPVIPPLEPHGQSARCAVANLFGVPTRAGRYRWRCSSMLPWEEVTVFESQVDGRLIAIMPHSGAHHYMSSHPASEWGGPSSPNPAYEPRAAKTNDSKQP